MRPSHDESGAQGIGTIVMMVVGALLLIVAAFAVAYPAWWNHRSTVVSQHLVKQFETTPPVKVAGVCVEPPPSRKGQVAAGIVKIAALSLTAPVLPGLTDADLAVAAGHDPASPWPGQEGESILESHDVSFFSRISSLRNGDTVVWINHCNELKFKVVGHEILSPGDVIDPPAGGHGLALVTCYPTDALFYTSYRYVLLTTYVSAAKAQTAPGPVHVVVVHVKVPAPPALVAQGLKLLGSGVLVGVLEETGDPSPGWLQGPAGIDLQNLALESYIGAEKAIAQHNSVWWHDLARPGLPMPHSVWSNSDDTNVTENVHGTHVVSVTLSSANETFVLVNVHGDLLIQSVTVP
jgi:LPXTG-site transpeptidase (sortase) family protein